MRVLCVNSIISEYGGAEFAAMNLAAGLASRGHDVHFLGLREAASHLQRSDMGSSAFALAVKHNIKLHREHVPRTYPLGQKHGPLRKLIWHIQDLTNPANERVFRDVLERVRPESVILHNVTGIGSNIWRTISASETPCVQVIHDLGLICLNKARFTADGQCRGLCLLCSLQKKIRFRMIDEESNFAFVSPSRAMMDEIDRYVDLSPWRRRIIANPNVFSVRARKVTNFERPRLLYVGRLDVTKGVDMMLRAIERAHRVVDFDIDLLGGGPLESELRQRYSTQNWIQFHGTVDQAAIAEFMARATALLVPSLWVENAPGVIVHAVFAALPVLGSRTGGIPEHIDDGRTGMLLPPGDEDAWTAGIVRVVSGQSQVEAWSAACGSLATKFDPERALDAYEDLMRAMLADRKSD